MVVPILSQLTITVTSMKLTSFQPFSLQQLFRLLSSILVDMEFLTLSSQTMVLSTHLIYLKHLLRSTKSIILHPPHTGPNPMDEQKPLSNQPSTFFSQQRMWIWPSCLFVTLHPLVTPIRLLSACLDVHSAVICLSFQLRWNLSLLHVIL